MNKETVLDDIYKEAFDNELEKLGWGPFGSSKPRVYGQGTSDANIASVKARNAPSDTTNASRQQLQTNKAELNQRVAAIPSSGGTVKSSTTGLLTK